MNNNDEEIRHTIKEIKGYIDKIIEFGDINYNNDEILSNMVGGFFVLLVLGIDILSNIDSYNLKFTNINDIIILKDFIYTLLSFIGGKYFSLLGIKLSHLYTTIKEEDNIFNYLQDKYKFDRMDIDNIIEAYSNGEDIDELIKSMLIRKKVFVSDKKNTIK